MTALYAIVRAMNGVTGNSGAAGDFTLAKTATDFTYATPAADLVRIVVSTELGTCIANPTIGTDWNGVEHDPGGMARGTEKRVKAALAPWVAKGRLATVDCQAEELPAGRVNFNVSFTDPRDPTTQQKPVAFSVQF